MKKIFTILVSLLISSACFAQTIIEMEKDGGVYKVPCKVNGVKMKFIFDSGASTVCISESMADYLYENGYITLDDVIGVGKSQVADGRIVENVHINLKDIEIAGMHLHNVEGAVILGLNGSLLLGQSAIQALGRVTIDGNRLVIHNASQSLSEEQIQYLRSEANRLAKVDDYHAALIHLRKLYNNDACDAFDLFGYAYSLSADKQYDEAIIVTQKWFDLYEMDAPVYIRYKLYDRQAINCYYATNPNYTEAINWAERLIPLTPLVFENAQEQDDELLSTYSFIGDAYLAQKKYYSAREMYEKAFNLRLSYFDCRTPKDIKKIKDERLGYFAYAIAACSAAINDFSNANRVFAISARLGYNEAIRMCKEYNIKY